MTPMPRPAARRIAGKALSFALTLAVAVTLVGAWGGGSAEATSYRFWSYWIGGDDLGFADEEGTDCKAAHEGYISVTPLQVDLTDYKLLLNSTLPSFSWP